MHQESQPRPSLAQDVRATLMPGFLGLSMPQWISTAFTEGLLSACVYGNNIDSREQLQALGRELRAASPGAILAIDEEGGEVTRLSYREGSPYPGAAVLGRIDDLSYTEEIGRRVGLEILDAGFNLALAPDADVNSNPRNPVIGTRSFGATPELAARHVAAWVRGLQGTGAIACPKHFPGHGDTAQDSHLALPVVDAPRSVLTSRELPPFAAAFDAGARSVMTSHILLPQLDDSQPATFSSLILGDLLRDQLGFTGVVVSDALDMKGASGSVGIPEAAVRALQAGCDLLCIGVDTTAAEFEEIVSHVVAAVASGRLPRERISEAAERVRGLSAEFLEGASSEDGARATNGASSEGGASSTEDAAGQTPIHTTSEAGSNDAELARIAASFDGAEAARGWVLEHPGAAVIRVETEANMAVGFAPWGPFAPNALAAVDPAAASAFTARPHLTVSAHESAASTAALLAAKRAGGAIVVGREIHRYEFSRALVDALQATGVPVLVVEMAWPADDGYATVSSFGSSALVGAALISLLEGGTQ